jgi:hypothetical protein
VSGNLHWGTLGESCKLLVCIFFKLAVHVGF